MIRRFGAPSTRITAALAAAVVAAVLLVPGAAQSGCGAQEAPCNVETGTYHAVVPQGVPVGAVMFLHGWGSSGEGSLRMTGMVNSLTRRGYAVIAPDGTPREGRSGRRWSFHPDLPAARDEFAFLAAVKADAAARFGFDAQNMILSGFSVGGSMASYVACSRPALFAAYAPVGGGLWRPHPEACTAPVSLFHTHGWSDGVVPVEGRAVRGQDALDPQALVQGDVFETLQIWRAVNGCVHFRADRFETEGRYWRRAWDRCRPGSRLELALHPGGHAIPRGWAEMMLDWYEAGAQSN